MANRLNEFLGPVHQYRNPQNTYTNQNSADKTSNHPIIKHDYGNYIKVKHCSTLRSWQNDVVRSLRNNNDIYALVGAGGGKTLPMICYWVNDLLGFNSTLQRNEPLERIKERVLNFFLYPERVPKLIFLVPIQRLVEGQYKEMYEVVCDIIIGYIHLLFQKENSHNAVFDILRIACNKLGDRRFNNDINNLIHIYQQTYDRYRHDPTNRKVYEYKLEQIMDNLIENSTLFLKDFIDRFIIGGAHGNKTFGTGGKNTIKDKPLITSVYESFESLMSKGDISKLNRSIFVFDEAHTAQDRVETDERADNITNVMYNHILKQLDKSNRIAFLSGTVNTVSAKTMCETLGQWFNRKIITINPGPSAGNQAKLNVVPDNSIVDDSRIVEMICNPKDTNNLVVLFSKKRIDNICSKAISKIHGTTLQNVDNDYHNNSYNKTSSSIKYKDSAGKQYGRNDYSEKLRDGLKDSLSAENSSARGINNDLLRECVKRGFGFIYRVENMAVKEQDDMSLLIELFKQGKIHTILATDSVGIGINISVKNLYISAAEKFNGKQLQSLMVSDLNQLINRAGRSAFKIANIYVPEMFLGDITTAISANMDQYESGKTIVDFSPRMLKGRVNYRRFNALMKTGFVKSLEKIDAQSTKIYNKIEPYIKDTGLDINSWKR